MDININNDTRIIYNKWAHSRYSMLAETSSPFLEFRSLKIHLDPNLDPPEQ